MRPKKIIPQLLGIGIAAAALILIVAKLHTGTQSISAESLLGNAYTATHAANPFGIYNGPIAGADAATDTSTKVGVEQTLGVSYVRLIISTVNLQSKAYGPFSEAGFKLLLTAKNIDYRATPSGPGNPPSDLAAYRQSIAKLIDAFPMEVLAVENEEDIDTGYSGTPEQYGEELAAAADVAHQKGVPVTNGGMTDVSVFLLAWHDAWTSGDRTLADAMAQSFTHGKTYHATIVNQLPSTEHPDKPLPEDNPSLAAKYQTAAQLLELYKTSAIDFVNFHWYANSPESAYAMGKGIDYLRKATGKPVMTNEIGQLDSSGATLTAMLQQALDKKLPYIIWFNGDVGTDGNTAKALHDADGTLRTNGEAFLAFMNEHYLIAEPTPPVSTPPDESNPDTTDTPVEQPADDAPEDSPQQSHGTQVSGGYVIPSASAEVTTATDQSLDTPVSDTIRFTTQKLPSAPSVPATTPAKSGKPALPAAAAIAAIDYVLDGELLHTATTFPDTWTLDTKTLSNDWHTLSTVYHRTDGTTAAQGIKLFKVENNVSVLERLQNGAIKLWDNIIELLQTVFD